MSKTHTNREPRDTGLGEDALRYALTLYVAFLQGIFNFLDNESGAHWEPDPENTQIWIGAEDPLPAEVVARRPAITVVMTPTQTSGLGINNMVTQNLATNETLFTDMETGHFVVYCIAHSDIKAKWLAQIVRNSSRQHRKLLEGEGGFHSIARPQVGINSPSAPGALISGATPNALVMVQVNVPFHFQWSWKTSIGAQAPQFRDIQQILGQLRARDYDYTAPTTLEKVQLDVNTRPRTIKLVRGRYALRPTTVEVGGTIEPFQQSDLRPLEES